MLTATTNSKRFLTAIPYLSNVDAAWNIARYFPPQHVKNLINQKAIYFHPVDQYRTDYEKGNGGDPHENRAPEAQYAGPWPRDNPRQREIHERIHDLKKKQVKPHVSCWTKFDDEDVRMWREYGMRPGSICLVTSVNKFLSSLSDSNVYVKAVHYVPEDSFDPSAHEFDRKRIEGSLFSFPALELEDVVLDCFLKTQDHQWEKEIRFAFFSQNELEVEKRLIKIRDLSRFAKRIIVSPGYDDNASVCRSTLSTAFNVPIEDSGFDVNVFSGGDAYHHEN